MLRSVFSSIKRMYTYTILSCYRRGYLMFPPGIFEKQSHLIVTAKESTKSGSKDDKYRCEKCMRIIEYSFGKSEQDFELENPKEMTETTTNCQKEKITLTPVKCGHKECKEIYENETIERQRNGTLSLGSPPNRNAVLQAKQHDDLITEELKDDMDTDRLQDINVLIQAAKVKDSFEMSSSPDKQIDAAASTRNMTKQIMRDLNEMTQNRSVKLTENNYGKLHTNPNHTINTVLLRDTKKDVIEKSHQASEVINQEKENSVKCDNQQNMFSLMEDITKFKGTVPNDRNNKVPNKSLGEQTPVQREIYQIRTKVDPSIPKSERFYFSNGIFVENSPNLQKEQSVEKVFKAPKDTLKYKQVEEKSFISKDLFREKESQLNVDPDNKNSKDLNLSKRTKCPENIFISKDVLRDQKAINRNKITAADLNQHSDLGEAISQKDKIFISKDLFRQQETQANEDVMTTNSTHQICNLREINLHEPIKYDEKIFISKDVLRENPQPIKFFGGNKITESKTYQDINDIGYQGPRHVENKYLIENFRDNKETSQLTNKTSIATTTPQIDNNITETRLQFQLPNLEEKFIREVAEILLAKKIIHDKIIKDLKIYPVYATEKTSSSNNDQSKDVFSNEVLKETKRILQRTLDLNALKTTESKSPQHKEIDTVENNDLTVVNLMKVPQEIATKSNHNNIKQSDIVSAKAEGNKYEDKAGDLLRDTKSQTNIRETYATNNILKTTHNADYSLLRSLNDTNTIISQNKYQKPEIDALSEVLQSRISRIINDPLIGLTNITDDDVFGGVILMQDGSYNKDNSVSSNLTIPLKKPNRNFIETLKYDPKKETNIENRLKNTSQEGSLTDHAVKEVSMGSSVKYRNENDIICQKCNLTNTCKNVIPRHNLDIARFHSLDNRREVDITNSLLNTNELNNLTSFGAIRLEITLQDKENENSVIEQSKIQNNRCSESNSNALLWDKLNNLRSVKILKFEVSLDDTMEKVKKEAIEPIYSKIPYYPTADRTPVQVSLLANKPEVECELYYKPLYTIPKFIKFAPRNLESAKNIGSKLDNQQTNTKYKSKCYDGIEWEPDPDKIPRMPRVTSFTTDPVHINLIKEEECDPLEFDDIAKRVIATSALSKDLGYFGINQRKRKHSDNEIYLNNHDTECDGEGIGPNNQMLFKKTDLVAELQEEHEQSMTSKTSRKFIHRENPCLFLHNEYMYPKTEVLPDLGQDFTIIKQPAEQKVKSLKINKNSNKYSSDSGSLRPEFNNISRLEPYLPENIPHDNQNRPSSHQQPEHCIQTKFSKEARNLCKSTKTANEIDCTSESKMVNQYVCPMPWCTMYYYTYGYMPTHTCPYCHGRSCSFKYLSQSNEGNPSGTNDIKFNKKSSNPSVDQQTNYYQNYNPYWYQQQWNRMYWYYGSPKQYTHQIMPRSHLNNRTTQYWFHHKRSHSTEQIPEKCWSHYHQNQVIWQHAQAMHHHNRSPKEFYSQEPAQLPTIPQDVCKPRDYNEMTTPSPLPNLPRIDHPLAQPGAVANQLKVVKCVTHSANNKSITGQLDNEAQENEIGPPYWLQQEALRVFYEMMNSKQFPFDSDKTSQPIYQNTNPLEVSEKKTDPHERNQKLEIKSTPISMPKERKHKFWAETSLPSQPVYRNAQSPKVGEKKVNRPETSHIKQPENKSKPITKDKFWTGKDSMLRRVPSQTLEETEVIEQKVLRKMFRDKTKEESAQKPTINLSKSIPTTTEKHQNNKKSSQIFVGSPSKHEIKQSNAATKENSFHFKKSQPFPSSSDIGETKTPPSNVKKPLEAYTVPAKQKLEDMPLSKLLEQVRVQSRLERSLKRKTRSRSLPKRNIKTKPPQKPLEPPPLAKLTVFQVPKPMDEDMYLTEWKLTPRSRIEKPDCGPKPPRAYPIGGGRRCSKPNPKKILKPCPPPPKPKVEPKKSSPKPCDPCAPKKAPKPCDPCGPQNDPCKKFVGVIADKVTAIVSKWRLSLPSLNKQFDGTASGIPEELQEKLEADIDKKNEREDGEEFGILNWPKKPQSEQYAKPKNVISVEEIDVDMNTV